MKTAPIFILTDKRLLYHKREDKSMKIYSLFSEILPNKQTTTLSANSWHIYDLNSAVGKLFYS